MLCGVVDLWIQRCKLVHWRQECVVNCVGMDCKVRLGTGSMLRKRDVTSVRVADSFLLSTICGVRSLLSVPLWLRSIWPGRTFGSGSHYYAKTKRSSVSFGMTVQI